ncbi:pyridoxal phosphate-dependent aminotransferase [Paludibacterium paludis]|uniref:Aminotransferase n=1 Tax=Paludibacterium paludis TaxID=1225769 RepID=A0A918P2K0_9NEIS|nr:pyridoxal phosphate-dependent aminotransferase [Paludibacterium paludis]GGY14894.1 aminotransferase [Paludibacterium paludis]
MTTLAERTRLITPPGTSKMRVLANELKAAGIHVVNFAAGELDFDTSPVVKTAAKAAIDAGRNTYTPTLGLASLRKAVAKRISARLGVDYAPGEVGLTAGAKQALYNAAMVLLNPGDEVIVPQPYWVTFPTQVEICGAIPVFVDTRDNGYRLLASSVERSLTPRTRAIIINSPNNPTGTLYEERELKKIARLAIAHNLWIIFDECYAELIRDGHQHGNIVQLCPEVKERTILVNSFSKSLALTGWRLGYVAAPEAVIKAMENLQGHTTSNPNSISQYAVEAALADDDTAFIDEVNRRLQARLLLAHELVTHMEGIVAAPAEGAFYLFLNIQSKIGRRFGDVVVRDVDHLCELLLSQARVAVVSGSAFGDASGIRVSYAISDDDIREGLTRMTEFFNSIH